jgi:hypothetical protein
MTGTIEMKRWMRGCAAAAVVIACAGGALTAQGRGGGDGQAPPSPQAAATDELTGYWVSVITEDWRWRMVTPARGDVASIPLTAAGLAQANQWDPERDAAMGEGCKSYGAPGLMRAPTRLNIMWTDDETLQVDTDYGEQTRLLRFGDAGPPNEPSLQGRSVAEWSGAGRGRGGGPPVGYLRVETTNVTAGYLRKNGVPYSADTVLTEYWDVFDAPDGDRWLVITSVVHDPENLQVDWITSLNFKQEADGSKWNPTACSTEW